MKKDNLPALVVKGCYTGKGGTAVTLTRDSVTALLQALGLGEVEESEQGEQWNTFHPIHLSCSQALSLSIRTPKGRVGEIVLGDSSINLAHQGEESAEIFNLIFQAASTGKQFALQVEEATQVALKRAKGKKVVNLDADAC